MKIRRWFAALAVVVCACAGGVASMPALALEPASACQSKCEHDYEEAAAKCGRIDDEGERQRCQTAAHDRYRTCGQGCPKGDDVEACKKGCDRKAAASMRKCEKMEPGPGRAKCRQVVEEQRSYCYRDCERKG